MENNELLSLMEKCGHFLYHRRGGKRGQIRILKLLNEMGAMTQREMLEYIKLKSGSLSETVGKLEARGFICKTKSETDRRKTYISLTEEGRKHLYAFMGETRKQEEILFNCLSSEEQEKLKALLTTVLDYWENSFESYLFNHREGD